MSFASVSSRRKALGLLLVVGCGQAQRGTDGGNSGAGAGGSAGGGAGSGGSSAGVGGSDGIGGMSGAAGTGGAQAADAGTAGTGTGGEGTAGVGGAATGGAGTTAIGDAGDGGTEGGSGGMDGGGTVPCTVTPTLALSTMIPTVATVTFTTSLDELTDAEIEFGPAAGGAMLVAPVELAQPDYETVLVGMKPTTSYVYRIKLTSSAGTCVSEDYLLTTGALEGVPELTVTIQDPAHHDRGFLVVSKGLSGPGASAFILDADGTVVWIPPDGAIGFISGRAHLSWDATRLIVIDVNFPKDAVGFMSSIAMDGSDLRNLPGVSAVHHDFVAIPGGIATLAWLQPNEASAEGPSALIEFLDSGQTRTVVPDLSTIYEGRGHANSIHYYDSDRSYTVGDPTANAYVKVTGEGELVWQFGGENPKDPNKFFAGVIPWRVNHGHHLTADGTFAFFNNGSGTDSSNVLVYELETETLEASPKATFPVAKSAEFGDVQRLPNGNFLLTASNSGVITEVTPEGSAVMTIQTAGQYFGYTEFRKSLYGPPPY